MKLQRLVKIGQTLFIGIGLVFLVNTISWGAVDFDVDAIEADITAAIATGDDPVLAAKSAVANAVTEIIAANPDYPGGKPALSAAIIEVLAYLKITGLDDTDLLLAANHALGNTVDPALEAYDRPGSSDKPNKASGKLGPGGKPRPGSPT